MCIVCTQNIPFPPSVFLQDIGFRETLYSASTSPTKVHRFPFLILSFSPQLFSNVQLRYIFAEITLNKLNYILLVLHASTCSTRYHNSHLLKYHKGKGKRQMVIQVPKGESKQPCLCKLPFAVVSFPNLRKDAYGKDVKLSTKI